MSIVNIDSFLDFLAVQGGFTKIIEGLLSQKKLFFCFFVGQKGEEEFGFFACEGILGHKFSSFFEGVIAALSHVVINKNFEYNGSIMLAKRTIKQEKYILLNHNFRETSFG